MIDYYNNETRLTEILRAVVNSSTIDLGPARTREEIFVSRALGLTMWPAIPPRTTMEMWLAFIAGDTAEPAAGTYTVRTCAESCVITYARRVRGASAVVPIFPPHTHYERALAKLAGIVPIDWGVLGREWEYLLQTLTVASMPRSAVTVIGGERVSIGPDGEIAPYQAGSGDASPTNKRPIFPGLTIVRDDGTALEVWEGALDIATGELMVTHDAITLTGAESWNHATLGGLHTFNINLPRAPMPTTAQIGGYPGLCDTFRVDTYDWVIGGVPLADNTARISAYRLTGSRASLLIVKNSTTTSANFKTWLASNHVTVVYPLATPVTYQLTQTEMRRALNCADYLGAGVWRLSCGGATVIHSQIRTDSSVNRYDVAPSTGTWSFVVTVDGARHSGPTGQISAGAGDHDVVIVATPGEDAGVCIIQPTLYYTAAAGLLGTHEQEPGELEEPAEPEEPEEPVEPEPEEPVEPEPEEPVEPEPEEPAEPEEPEEPEEPAEPETTKRRRSK